MLGKQSSISAHSLSVAMAHSFGVVVPCDVAFAQDGISAASIQRHFVVTFEETRAYVGIVMSALKP